MPEDLLDEERIPFGLLEDGVHDCVGWRSSRQGLDHSRDTAAVETLHGEAVNRSIANHSFERGRERTGDVELHVAVRPDAEHPHLGHDLGHVLDEQQRRYVGPVDVVHHEQEREPGGGSSDEGADGVEEVPPLLFRRQVERRRDVGEATAQLGDHPRHFGGIVAHVLADDLRRHDRQPLLEHLDERRVGQRPFDLIAAAEQGERASRLGFADELAHERRLADARFAADEDEPATTVRRGSVQMRPKNESELLLAPDEDLLRHLGGLADPDGPPTAATGAGSL